MPHHGEPPAAIGGLVHYARYLWDIFSPDMFNNAIAFVTGFVTLVPFQVHVTTTIDRLIHLNSDPSTGNFRVGIYADNGDTPVGGALLSESLSTPTVGILQKQEIALIVATLQLPQGLYWLAFQNDTAADAEICHLREMTQGGTLTSHSYALVYGPFTDPCPVTDVVYAPIAQGVRVASVP